MQVSVIALLIILQIFACAHANPCLQQTRRHEAVSRDLEQLLLSYQHCNIHIMLYDMEVDIHGAPVPHVLTILPENHSYDTFLQIGGLALPQMRHIVDHCQATFQVLLSKRRSYWLARRDSLVVGPDEGDSAWYQLKRRYSFLMVTYTAPFWDSTAFPEVGGNLFVVLTYNSGLHSQTASS